MDKELNKINLRKIWCESLYFSYVWMYDKKVVHRHRNKIDWHCRKKSIGTMYIDETIDITIASVNSKV